MIKACQYCKYWKGKVHSIKPHQDAKGTFEVKRCEIATYDPTNKLKRDGMVSGYGVSTGEDFYCPQFQPITTDSE